MVDCLFPGQVRVVGGRTYLTPRRPTRTTAADCGARGGEYLAYDRADYRSALAVWLPAAEQGDAEAQTFVGEIYERGVGGEPNYARQPSGIAVPPTKAIHARSSPSARSTSKGSASRRQTQALNWYRRASGLGGGQLDFSLRRRRPSRSAAIAS